MDRGFRGSFRRLYIAAAAGVLLSPLATPAQSSITTENIVSELRGNRAADALRDSEAALRSQPQDARLWILKGIAANQLHQPEVALAAFQGALRIAPRSLPALEGASEVAFRIDRPAAWDLVKRLLAQAPDEPQANGMAGMLEVERGDWTDAAEHFSKAGSSIANQKGALEAQIAALDHLNRDAEAEAVAQHMLEVWPEDANIRYNLAVLELRQGHADTAIATLKPLLATANEATLSLAASAYEALGETPNAVDLLRRAIQQNPKDPQNYLDFATLSFDHNSFAAGITMLDAGLTQLPNSAALHVARGVLYMQSSQMERAEQEFQTANRLDPSQSFGLEAQGLTEMQRHNLPEALEKVRGSLKQSPGSAYLNYLAAEILKEQGAPPNSPEETEAIGYARHAVAADASLVPALDLLSSFEFQDGDFPDAARECRAVLKQDPLNQEAIFRLILTLRRTGDKDKEIAGLLESLKRAKAQDHEQQVRLDKYRLTEGAGKAPAAP